MNNFVELVKRNAHYLFAAYWTVGCLMAGYALQFAYLILGLLLAVAHTQVGVRMATQAEHMGWKPVFFFSIVTGVLIALVGEVRAQSLRQNSSETVTDLDGQGPSPN